MPLALRPASVFSLTALALACALPAHAAGVVGTGTAMSCTEAALDTALAGGGAVTFNCGAAPIAIPITVSKQLATATQIDGGGLITLQGDGNVRLFELSGGAFTMTGVVLSDGMTIGNGAAILIDGGTLLLDNVTLMDNAGTGMFSNGGAIYAYNGTQVTLQRVTATANTAQYGGAIATDATSTLTLTEFIADGNTAVNDGGAVRHMGTALTITQSLFTGNQAGTPGSSGGAIIVSPNTTSTLSIANSTFHSNRHTGGGSGSAIGVTGGVAAGTITNSTFADNDGAPGTIAVSGNSQLTLRNTIVSNAMGFANCAVFGMGTIVDGGNNLQWGGIQTLSCGATMLEEDPLLAPLANNGGFSQTMALQTGSPAINTGSGCPAMDQRGVARPIGPACDIGAFESPLGFTGVPPAATTAAIPTLGHAGLALLSALVAGMGVLRQRRFLSRNSL